MNWQGRTGGFHCQEVFNCSRFISVMAFFILSGVHVRRTFLPIFLWYHLNIFVIITVFESTRLPSYWLTILELPFLVLKTSQCFSYPFLDVSDTVELPNVVAFRTFCSVQWLRWTMTSSIINQKTFSKVFDGACFTQTNLALLVQEINMGSRLIIIWWMINTRCFLWFLITSNMPCSL